MPLQTMVRTAGASVEQLNCPVASAGYNPAEGGLRQCAQRRSNESWQALWLQTLPVTQAAGEDEEGTLRRSFDLPPDDTASHALDAYLESDRSPPESMLISDLDGFLTAVAIGPELIKPSEWLPVVWGGEQPVFADQNEAQAVFDAIMSRYNEILRDVEQQTLEPIFWAARRDRNRR